MKEDSERIASPDLFTVSLVLRPLAAGVVPVSHGYHVYAMFLGIIRAADSALAERLHADEAAKPFTVSPLEGKLRRNGVQLSVPLEARPWVRLTFLNSTIFSHFMDAAMRWGGRPVEIAGLRFSVEKVVTAPGEGAPAAFRDYQGILDSAVPARVIELAFVTPTAFRSGGRRNVAFPEPALVFGSYWNRWQAFSPVKMEASVTSAFEKISVTRYRLETRVWDFGAYQETGYFGTARFEISPQVPEMEAAHLNALADLAPFCGTGAKTTMGMGQTRRVEHAGPVSRRAGGNHQEEGGHAGSHQE